MQSIELRQNKASMSCMLWLLGLASAGAFCFVCFFSKPGINPIKIILLLAACGIAYVVWSTTQKLKKNEPLLTFFANGLEINETKPVMLLWPDITSWNVTRSDATDYLIINTNNKIRSINISWLEVQPAEVETLMKTFTQTSAGRL